MGGESDFSQMGGEAGVGGGGLFSLTTLTTILNFTVGVTLKSFNYTTNLTEDVIFCQGSILAFFQTR